MYYFLSHHPNPAPAYGRICFFTLHFVNRPMLGLFSRIKSTVKSIQACRGRWKSFEDWGRRPWVGSSMAAAEFPCHRLRGFRHGVLALLELGARLDCWSYRTAYVLRLASCCRLEKAVQHALDDQNIPNKGLSVPPSSPIAKCASADLQRYKSQPSPSHRSAPSPTHPTANVPERENDQLNMPTFISARA